MAIPDPHEQVADRELVDFEHRWPYAREIYQLPGARGTCDVGQIKAHYYRSHEDINPTGFVPVGPEADWSGLTTGPDSADRAVLLIQRWRNVWQSCRRSTSAHSGSMALGALGSLGALVVVVAIGVLLRRSGAPMVPVVLLGAAPFAMVLHAGTPLDALGMGLFLVGLVWLELRWPNGEKRRDPPAVEPIETDGTCLNCGESGLRSALKDQYFVLQCPACDQPNFSYRITPAQLRGHDGTALIDAVTRDLVADILKMRQGVRPDCAGRIDTEVIDASDHAIGTQLPTALATSSTCRQCLRFLSLSLTHAAAHHPESIAFHWKYGVDIMTTGIWEFHRYLQDGRLTADDIGTDPDEYRVGFRRDTAVLRLYLDGNATVSRSERVQRRNQNDRRSG